MYKCIYNGMQKVLKVFLVLDMILITAMVTLQVISRYVFNNPTMWSEEVAVYALVYFTFLGSALGISQKQMLKITILPDALPKDKSIILNIFTNVMSIALLVFVIAFSPAVFKELLNYLTPALRIPKSIVFISIPLGAVLMIISFIEEIREQLNEYKALKKGAI